MTNTGKILPILLDLKANTVILKETNAAIWIIKIATHSIWIMAIFKTSIRNKDTSLVILSRWIISIHCKTINTNQWITTSSLCKISTHNKCTTSIHNNQWISKHTMEIKLIRHNNLTKDHPLSINNTNNSLSTQINSSHHSTQINNNRLISNRITQINNTNSLSIQTNSPLTQINYLKVAIHLRIMEVNISWIKDH